MKKHKVFVGIESLPFDFSTEHYKLTIDSSQIIYLEPLGVVNASVVQQLLVDTARAAARLRAARLPVRILINVSNVTKYQGDIRQALWHFYQLDFDHAAIYGGTVRDRAAMQYLRHKLGAKFLHYYRTREAALQYLLHPPTPRFAGRFIHRQSIRFVVFSALILALVLIGSVVSRLYVQNIVDGESAAAFKDTATSSQAYVEKTVQVYAQSLYGFRGLFASNVPVTTKSFHDYFQNSNVVSALPAITAVSYAKHLPAASVSQYLTQLRKDTSLPGVSFKTLQISPATVKSEYDVLSFTAPDSAGRVGYDLSSDIHRAPTLQAARDSGELTASPSIMLLNTPPTRGFFLSLPIYSGQTPTTVAQRRAQLSGYVNMIFEYGKYFDGAFTSLNGTGVHVAVHDSQNRQVYQRGKPAAGDQSLNQTLRVGGQAFTVTYSASANYGLSATTIALPMVSLLRGVVTCVLLASLLYLLLRSRGQVLTLASSMTEDLERERNAALDNNRRLQAAEQALVAEKTSVEHKVTLRTRELNEAHAQLEASLRGLPFGYAIIDRKRQIVFSNAALSAILLHNTPGSPADTGDALSAMAELMRHQFNLLDIVQRAELHGKTIIKEATLNTRSLRFLFVPVMAPTASARAVGCVLIVEDQSDEKAQQRTRDEFFSIASHELRTPLTVIRGNTSMILDHYAAVVENPDLKELILDTHSAAERLIAMVNDFLDMSRLEQRRFVLHSGEMDIVDRIDHILREMKVTAQSRNIKLKLEAAGPHLWLVTDHDRVEQIVLNLLGNALKFTSQGMITVTVKQTDGHVKVSVTDTGAGIAPQSQHLLFHKFQQASDNALTRDRTQSTGLGLYISKLIAQAMGGSLYLEKSELGRGSTFTLELPFVKPDVKK